MNKNIDPAIKRPEKQAAYRCLLPSLFLMLLFIPASLRADYMPLPLVSSGFSWQASTDGINWLPAYPEYPNGLTVPFPATTEGVFMWYWNTANGKPTGTNGPNTVFFKATFTLADLHGKSAGAWIAVDDWMRLSVNGVSAATYQLEFNFNNERQPIPKFVDFTSLLNTRYQGNLTGYNTITIEAHDGGPVAYDRIYEWLFFDALSVNTTPVLDSPSKINQPVCSVPEPAASALLWVGLLPLAGIVVFSRKKRT